MPDFLYNGKRFGWVGTLTRQPKPFPPPPSHLKEKKKKKKERKKKKEKREGKNKATERCRDAVGTGS